MEITITIKQLMIICLILILAICLITTILGTILSDVIWERDRYTAFEIFNRNQMCKFVKYLNANYIIIDEDGKGCSAKDILDEWEDIK